MVPGTWKAPDYPILPEQLEDARTVIERQLQPAGDAGIRDALLPMLMAGLRMPNMEGMPDDVQQKFFAGQVSEYTRLLGHVPLDIFKAACDAHVLESDWFPTVAQLNKHAGPALEKRRRQRDRILRLIDIAKKKAEPARTETEVERLNGDIERWRKRPGHFLADMLKRTAIRAEKRLAEIEGREVAEWARDAEQHVLPPMPGLPTFGEGRREAPIIDVEAEVVPETPSDWKRPPTEPWRAGEPVYQRAPEEPPPPTSDDDYGASAP
jgi:hypothetical protein